MQRQSHLLTLGLSSVAHTYSHLFTLLYATVVLVLEKEWGLSYAELIALSLPMTVLFGLGALPAGWAADRWGATPLMLLFFLGVGGASVLTGLATSPLGIALGLALIGLFGSIYHPVGIPWLIKHAVNRGRALGINGIFGSVGIASGSLVAGSLSAWLGWRWAFILPGVVCIATGLVFAIAAGRGQVREEAHDVKPSAAPEAGEARRVFFILSLTMLCTGLMYQVISVALPKLFEERLGDLVNGSVLGIGGLVTLVYATSAVTTVLGGEAADRWALRTIYAGVQILQVPAIAAMLVLYNPALVGAAMMMVGLSSMGGPAENALLARYTPQKWRGRAFGAKFVLSLGVSALGVALVPVVHSLTGSLDGVLVALLVFATACAVFALMLPREERRAPVLAAAE
jgi:FSR family fosmidomycin resistance protein-like MFS transporter